MLDESVSKMTVDNDIQNYKNKTHLFDSHNFIIKLHNTMYRNILLPLNVTINVIEIENFNF